MFRSPSEDFETNRGYQTFIDSTESSCCELKRLLMNERKKILTCSLQSIFVIMMRENYFVSFEDNPLHLIIRLSQILELFIKQSLFDLPLSRSSCSS